MRGHEYIRDAVLGYLAASVPPRLAAHLTEIGQTHPEPGSVGFVLADSLQDITEGFPLVAVRSTDAPDVERFDDAVFGVTYDLEVMVACDHRTYGPSGFEQASRARDRLLLAVRESLWRVKGMTSADPDGDIEFLSGRRVERTGRGNVQTLDGVALAVGTVSLRARVTEILADLAPPEQIDAIDLSVSGVDAAQSI